MTPVSLLEFVRLLLASGTERARFGVDPCASLARHGLAQLSPTDVHDAVLLAEDTITVDWSQAYGAGAAAPASASPEEQQDATLVERATATPAHRRTAEADTTSIEVADERPPTPRDHPDGHPAGFHDLPEAPDLHFGS